MNPATCRPPTPSRNRPQSSSFRVRNKNTVIAFRKNVLALCLMTFAPCAFGLTSEGFVDDVFYSVYAPDWTWQGRDANIMAVFENSTNSIASCSISLVVLKDHVDHFGRNGAPATPETIPLSTEISVPPGETRRIALTGFTALHGFPRQTYPLVLSLRINDTPTSVEYPLRTIRGQAVSEGRAVALGVPIGVALLFSAAFAFVLRRTGDRDAWKTVPLSTPEPDHPESWIHQTRK